MKFVMFTIIILSILAVSLGSTLEGIFLLLLGIALFLDTKAK